MAEAPIHPLAQKRMAEAAIHPSAAVHSSVATHELVAAQQTEKEAIHPSAVPLAEEKIEEASIPQPA